MKQTSPYKKKVYLPELKRLRKELEHFGRYLRIFASKSGHILIADGGTMMGPMPNWRAKLIMKNILEWHEKQAAQNESAAAHVRRLIEKNMLFLTYY